MHRALITVALVLSASAMPAQVKVKPAAAKDSDRAVAASQPSTYDPDAEQQLLQLANQARIRSGAPPLHFDEGLTIAARMHADVMARHDRLSHQFDGEPSLPHRMATFSSLHLDHAGENVAVDLTPEQAHERLMQSPPHRENLLDASYNVIGIGVIHDGARMFVVQDFGHSLPESSPGETEETIVNSVTRMRRAAGLPLLAQKPDSALREAVCAMAQEDRLATRAMHDLAQRYYVVSYTNMHPEILPEAVNRLVGDRHVKNVSVSACYARTATYPTGVYWVGLLFY